MPLERLRQIRIYNGTVLALSAMLCVNAVPTPGYSIAVLRHGHVVYTKTAGYADLRFRIPVTPNTRFITASAGKQITAFLVYHLARQKRLDVRRSIRVYLPELPAYAAPVTVQNLLWQTSGLRDYIDLSALAGHSLGDAFGLDDVFALMSMQHGLNFAPGTRYQYSNTNYALLGEIVHRVSGMPFGAYCAAMIFGPLHMTHTVVSAGAGAIYPDFASSYWPAQSGFIEAHNGSSTVGDGNTVTTASDYLIWEREVLHPHLDATAMRDVKQTVRLNDGTIPRKGMGSTLEYNANFGLPGWTFDGGTAGFRSLMVAYPSLDAAVVVFTNVVTDDGSEQLVTAARNVLGVKIPPSPIRPPPSPVPAATLPAVLDAQQFTGAYSSDETGQTMYVCAKNGALVVRQAFSPEVALAPSDTDTFSGSYWWMTRVHFERNAAHQVIRLSVDSFRGVQDVRYVHVSNTCRV